jgi:hypothetical protein
MTDADIERIRNLVRTWPAEPITWDLIRDRVAAEIQGVVAGKKKPRGSDAMGWSRQALSKHDRIKKAYEDRRSELRAERGRIEKNPRRNRDPEVVLLRRERDGLRITIAELEKKLALYEERLQTLLYNKALGAAGENELLEPLLPKIDRLGRTE